MLAVVGGEVHTVARGTLAAGTVLVDGGRILAVEEGYAAALPPGTEVLDARGCVVTPGLIDAHTHAGLHEEGLGWEGADYNEASEPLTPHLRARDGINPDDDGIRDALAAGVTAAYVTPGSANVLGGLGCVIRLAGGRVDDMVVRDPAGLKAAFGENPKRIHGREHKRSPMTRMAIAALLREALIKARAYQQRRAAVEPDKRPDPDLRHEAVLRVLSGEIPLRCHAHRADDILTALRIGEEFGVPVVVDHATEAHLLADRLAAGRIPCLVGPSMASRSKVELRRRAFESLALLERAGVPVCVITDHPVTPLAYLPICAALAVRAGMSREGALRAVTLTPAEVLGVADRLGSLEPGKAADLVVWEGHPFELTTRVRAVVVEGRIVVRDGRPCDGTRAG
ncbi:MAG TPA: amidohydrolase [Thermodesulfobacteriota bacterium]|nr:amidohydrolase [Thermodesulfobacteriota bacterium]